MRTRFAPSPTGLLHVGGLRTALYSYLLARQTKGVFLLRIEDTDQVRSVPGAIENILLTLEWAGLSPDEGVILRDGNLAEEGPYGPYQQSLRLDHYRKAAETLRASGHAYPCFCTPARLEEMRSAQTQRKEAPMYDRTCLKLSKEEVAKKIASGEPHVLRLLVPRTERISYVDEIRGEVSFLGHTVDDQVLMKSDGYPTYHLAHVVDDHAMKIDLVIRGEEWLSSTPKHLLLFAALGWDPPKYAHVPLLLNPDKTKLSKRQSAVAAEDYRAKGYLPEALVNFLAFLGWNPGTEQELFSLPELIASFSLDRVQRAGAIFDTTKLDWLQGQWMRRLPPEEFVRRLLPVVAERFPQAKEDPEFPARAALLQERITFLPEGAELLRFFYEEPMPTIDLLANRKQGVTEKLLPEILPALEACLNDLDQKAWSPERLKASLTELAQGRGWKIGQVLWVLRAALTGLPYSPGAYEVASALGRMSSLKRLASARALVGH